MSSSPCGNHAHCHSDGLPGDAETLEGGRDAEMLRAARFDVDVRKNSEFNAIIQTLP